MSRENTSNLEYIPTNKRHSGRKIAAGVAATVFGMGSLAGCASPTISASKEIPPVVKVEMPIGSNTESLEGEPGAVLREAVIAKSFDMIDRIIPNDPQTKDYYFHGKLRGYEGYTAIIDHTNRGPILLVKAVKGSNPQERTFESSCTFGFQLDPEAHRILNSSEKINPDVAKRAISQVVANGGTISYSRIRDAKIGEDYEEVTYGEYKWYAIIDGEIVYEGNGIDGRKTVDSDAEFRESIKTISECL